MTHELSRSKGSSHRAAAAVQIVTLYQKPFWKQPKSVKSIHGRCYAFSEKKWLGVVYVRNVAPILGHFGHPEY